MLRDDTEGPGVVRGRRWARLVEALGDRVFYVDCHGGIVDGNAEARAFGKHGGRPVPADLERVTNLVREVVACRAQRETVVTLEGGERDLVRVVPDLVGGECEGVFVIGTPVTTVEAESTMFRTLAALSPDLFVRYDASGCRTYLGDAWRRLGFSNDDLLKMTPAQARVVDDPAAFMAAVRATIATGETGEISVEGTHPDGTRHAYDVTFVAERDLAGHVVGAFSYARDVTRRKEAEGASRVMNEQLARAMSQLVEAEKLAALGNLVAGVAHELNTPLGNALMVATTLTTRLSQFEAEAAAGAVRRSSLANFISDAREALDLLLRSHERAVRLVGQFKAVAVDQTSDRRRAFRIPEVLTELLAVCDAGLRSRGISLHVGISREATDVVLDSYPGPLGQVFLNLIQNALFHAFPEVQSGNLMVDVSVREDGQMVVICVSDDGVGMSPSTLKHVFEPFFTTKLGTGGSGLGMTIVRNTVRGLLGGEVTVDSLENAGTRVVLRIPTVAPRREGQP